MHRKGALRVLGAVAILALVAAGCSNNNGGGGGGKKAVKLAFFGALTGPAAGLVVPGWKSVQMVVADANAGKYGNLPVTITGSVPGSSRGPTYSNRCTRRPPRVSYRHTST